MSISKQDLAMARRQFALDCNLAEARKINDSIYLAPYKVSEGARVINGMSPEFRAISFLGCVYVAADPDTLEGWEEILRDYPGDWFFNFGRLRKIDYILNSMGLEIADTHIYYLPDEASPFSYNPDVLDGIELHWLTQKEIDSLRGVTPYVNALCFSPTQPDIYALEAIDGSGHSLGMAGASLDGLYMRQIGIDIQPGYRAKGLATALVTLLKSRIAQDGRLPFYGTGEGHSISRMVGIKSGFLPAFAEIFVAEKNT